MVQETVNWHAGHLDVTDQPTLALRQIAGQEAVPPILFGSNNTMASNEKALSSAQSETDEDRRKFLASCGKFAVVTPPAIAMLLSTSLTTTAIAHSGGSHSDHRRRRKRRHSH